MSWRHEHGQETDDDQDEEGQCLICTKGIVLPTTERGVHVGPAWKIKSTKKTQHPDSRRISKTKKKCDSSPLFHLYFVQGSGTPLCWSISCLKGPFLYILLQHETNGEFSPQHWSHMKIIDGSLDQFRAFQMFQSQYGRVLRGFANAWDLDDTCHVNTLRTYSLSLSLSLSRKHCSMNESPSLDNFILKNTRHSAVLESITPKNLLQWSSLDLRAISQPSASWDFRSAACFHSTVDRMKGTLNFTLYKKLSLEIYEILHKSQKHRKMKLKHYSNQQKNNIKSIKIIAMFHVNLFQAHSSLTSVVMRNACAISPNISLGLRLRIHQLLHIKKKHTITTLSHYHYAKPQCVQLL